VRLAEGLEQTNASVRHLAGGLEQTNVAVRALAEAQKRTDDSLGTLTDNLGTLTERVDRLAQLMIRGATDAAERHRDIIDRFDKIKG
jgi:methyl-accepting chemotaxis protein